MKAERYLLDREENQTELGWGRGWQGQGIMNNVKKNNNAAHCFAW